jgi:MFS family permease
MSALNNSDYLDINNDKEDAAPALNEFLLEENTNDAQFDDKTKRKVLISCLISLTVGNMMLDNVYATLPKYIDERNLTGDWSNYNFEFTEVNTTIVLIMFSVAQLLFAPFTAYLKNTIGSKNTISAGFILMTITTYGLGALTYIDDPFLFFVVGNILRFF